MLRPGSDLPSLYTSARPWQGKPSAYQNLPFRAGPTTPHRVHARPQHMSTRTFYDREKSPMSQSSCRPVAYGRPHQAMYMISRSSASPTARSHRGPLLRPSYPCRNRVCDAPPLPPHMGPSISRESTMTFPPRGPHSIISYLVSLRWTHGRAVR